jgi:hypothetical protein
MWETSALAINELPPHCALTACLTWRNPEAARLAVMPLNVDVADMLISARVVALHHHQTHRDKSEHNLRHTEMGLTIAGLLALPRPPACKCDMVWRMCA